jgi:cytochrome c oxidase cbb3-type subunit 3/ubiquinol-cytochrome c reductase cytochrome c subunit
MPAFEGKLTAQGIDDVIAALRGFQPVNPEGHIAMRPAAASAWAGAAEPQGSRAARLQGVQDMTPADVIHEALASGARFAILDARAPSDYMREHITGAVSVPFYDPSPYFAALPKDTWLVCYCACPHAESGQLAQQLGAQGSRRWRSWTKASGSGRRGDIP